MLGGGSEGVPAIVSVDPALFLVTKEETLEEENASQIPQNQATF